MKKVIYYSAAIILLYCFYSCSYGIYNPKCRYRPHGETLIKQLLNKSDTVYVYGWEMSAFPRSPRVSYIWYHKNNHIHLYLLQSGRAKKYREIPAINYTIEDTIAKYEYGITRGWPKKFGECVDGTYTDTYLSVYIKNEKKLIRVVNNYLLQEEECKTGTFKYKLQYDLQKVTECLKPYISKKKIDRYY
ncbi:MAG: hypothetical protein R3Y59_09330 [bacterium]